MKREVMTRWYTLMFAPFLTTTLAFAVLTCSAFAQDRPCAGDVQKLCTDVEPGNRGGMLQCLKEHKANLSDACKQRLQTFAHEPCAEDAEKLCTDIQLGDKLEMVHCLREHDTDLSDACKERLHSFWGRLL
jgi:hypothetical protein